jgi:hypothetical protein
MLMVSRNRRLSIWFWVALVAVITNKELLQLVVHVFEQGLQLLGLH